MAAKKRSHKPKLTFVHGIANTIHTWIVKPLMCARCSESMQHYYILDGDSDTHIFEPAEKCEQILFSLLIFRKLLHLRFATMAVVGFFFFFQHMTMLSPWRAFFRIECVNQNHSLLHMNKFCDDFSRVVCTFGERCENCSSNLSTHAQTKSERRRKTKRGPSTNVEIAVAYKSPVKNYRIKMAVP